MRLLSTTSTAILAACWLFSPFARAQPTAPGPDAAKPEQGEPVTPPEVLSEPSIPYPEVEGEGKPVSVVLAITIDENGQILDPEVVEGAGEPFDSLALERIAEFQFRPATQGGQPIRARIQYRLTFTPPLAEPEPEPEPEPVAPPPVQEPPPPTPPPAAAAPADDEESYEATAEVEAPRREVTRRTVAEKQLTTVPGVRGDALRSVEILPGVGRGEFASDGPPVIRGADNYDSVVELDGVPVPFLYHFGGLTSFYNSHLLKEVELYPGNFSSRYGRYSGGVIEAKTRDPATDRFHGMLELSAIDSQVLMETPVGENTAIALAARRSNIDFFFDKLVPKDAYTVSAAPVYYDYQAMLTHEFSKNHRLRLKAYGSHDALRLFFSEPNDEDPALRDSIEGTVQLHRLDTQLQSRLGPSVEQNLTLSVGPSFGEQTFGELHQKFDEMDVYGRADWSIFATDNLRVDLGLDAVYFRVHGIYVGPPPPQEEGDPSANQQLGTYDTVRVEDTLDIFRPGGYAELSYRPIQDLLLVPGVRVDYFQDAAAWTIDPRFSTRYSITDSTTLKGGVGTYSQSPEWYQLMPQIGNPRLTPFRALHTSLGVEQRIFRGLDVGVEGFYKHLYDRVVGTPGGEAPYFTNDGTGRIYGVEFSTELNRGPHFGYIAYTLSRSERNDRGEGYRLFDQDQTHVLSTLYSYDFGSGWSAGARFRLVSGNPTTPVVAGVYDANSDLYLAVYGPTNSERLPTFHQLDVRGEKKWTFDDWSLTAYLEVLNAYNQQNVEGQSYSFDYTKKESATGLPIFPNIGIRGEL